MVACYYGFEKKLALSQIPHWIQLLGGYLDEGKNDPLSANHFGYNTYLDNIESIYQGYKHKLFQNSQSVYGPMASFQELDDLINSRSTTSGEDCLIISVSSKQVSTWVFFK